MPLIHYSPDVSVFLVVSECLLCLVSLLDIPALQELTREHRSSVVIDGFAVAGLEDDVYSFEQRTRAVELYIKYSLKATAIIQEFRYPKCTAKLA